MVAAALTAPGGLAPDAAREAAIAFNQTLLACKLTFAELITEALPLSDWWRQHVERRFGTDAASAMTRLSTALRQFANRADLERIFPAMGPQIVFHLDGVPGETSSSISQSAAPVTGQTASVAEQEARASNIAVTTAQEAKKTVAEPANIVLTSDLLLLVRNAGAIYQALMLNDADVEKRKRGPAAKAKARETAWQKICSDTQSCLHACADLWGEKAARLEKGKAAESGGNVSRRHNGLIWAINVNRTPTVSVALSRQTVKADAVSRVFNVSCKDVAWAVVDTGIDATHPAFRRKKPGTNQYYSDAFEAVPTDEDAPGSNTTVWLNRTRVRATYDFTRIRELLSFVTSGTPLGEELARSVENDPDLRASLETLGAHLQNGGEVDWALMLPLFQVPHWPPQAGKGGDMGSSYRLPDGPAHGTHVAGILAADWNPDGWPDDSEDRPPADAVQGICPDLDLYDLRVLRGDDGDSEFAIISALQFVRYLNAHQDFLSVHGVNLSMSIEHNVKAFACGRTPICQECERLVAAGVVVVAAAGNTGYQAGDVGGQAGNYRTVTITDPGNAESVITVGSTHRTMPHQYGVSFFSSRGPTGDGRSKPDLVAPGEKIEAPVPDKMLQRMDGTSMAAPHVSGAAALLIARYRELSGNPARIKKVLCDTATDLGRERSFQGAGMLDILRALQAL